MSSHSNTRSNPMPGDPAEAFFTSLGKTVAGPLLSGFVNWIGQQVRSDRPDCLLFLGRDGHIVSQAFELIRPNDLGDLPVHYVLASRRALRVAALDRNDPDFLDLLTSHAEGLSFHQILGRLNLPQQLVDTAFHEQPTSEPDTLYNHSRKADVAALLDGLWEPLLEQAEVERNAYLAYLESKGIGGQEHLGIVDIGWHGSLQRALTAILANRRTVRSSGYYLGVFPDGQINSSPGRQMKGYLVNGEQPPGRFQQLQPFVELVEFLFSSTEEGLVCFTLDPSGNPQPKRTGESLSDYQRTAIRCLWQGALDHVRENPEPASDPWDALVRIGLSPDKREARFLGPLQTKRGVGAGDPSSAFAETGSVLLNLLDWQGFNSRFKNALWRPGFWARLSFIERCLLKRLSPVGTKPLVRS